MYLHAPTPVGLTEDQERELLELARRHEQSLVEIREQQERDRHLRKITIIAGVASALFAAGRLGIMAVPFIRERRRRAPE